MLVYTDGGCSGNPGPGGWAYVIVREPADSGLPYSESANKESPESGKNIYAEKWGAEKNTTNNRMELMAVISALEVLGSIESIGDIKVFTDSQYVQK